MGAPCAFLEKSSLLGILWSLTGCEQVFPRASSSLHSDRVGHPDSTSEGDTRQAVLELPSGVLQLHLQASGERAGWGGRGEGITFIQQMLFEWPCALALWPGCPVFSQHGVEQAPRAYLWLGLQPTLGDGFGLHRSAKDLEKPGWGRVEKISRN